MQDGINIAKAKYLKKSTVLVMLVLMLVNLSCIQELYSSLIVIAIYILILSLLKDQIILVLFHRTVVELEIINLDKLNKILKYTAVTLSKKYKKNLSNCDFVYLGDGFLWQARHARALYDKLNIGLSVENSFSDRFGSKDIHAIEYLNNQNLICSTKVLNGHSIIFGTTGTGKTSFLILHIMQAILRNETVIVIDPKGDQNLCNMIQRCSLKASRQDSFIHLDVLDDKGLFNPLSSYIDTSEIGSRIGQLLPSEGSAQSFKAFSEMAVSACASMLNLMHKKITLYNLLMHIQDHDLFLQTANNYLKNYLKELDNKELNLYYNRICGVSNQDNQDLSVQSEFKNLEQDLQRAKNFLAQRNVDFNADAFTIDNFIKDKDDIQTQDEKKPKSEDISLKNKSTAVKSKTNKTTKKSAKANIPSLHNIKKFYQYALEKGYIEHNVDLSNVLAVASLDKGYYQKVTAAIIPLLQSLCSSNLVKSLSSNQQSPSFNDVICQNKIIYIALHCLQNATVGGNLGKLLVSDLASCVGILYANSMHLQRVNIFLDEASELVNESLTQLLNKSRGANFALTIATQTFGDLVKRAGSHESAMQILGNCNNLYSLRCSDVQSAEYIAKHLISTQKANLSSALTYTQQQGKVNNSLTRQISFSDCPIFSQDAIKLLPNFEFICKLADGSFYKGIMPLLIED